jgi:hypothetical protein
MAERFERFAQRHRDTLNLEGRRRNGLTAGSARMLATRLFLDYFAVEILFGVRNHFGKNSEKTLREITEVLRHGMLKEPAPTGETRRQVETVGV